MPSEDPSFVSLGMVVIDELHFPSREPLIDIPGGSGAYGQRVFPPSPIEPLHTISLTDCSQPHSVPAWFHRDHGQMLSAALSWPDMTFRRRCCPSCRTGP